MSKEQPCLCEQSPGATSIKNVKDKHNCVSLLAKHGSKADADDFSGRGSNCSSEKDSGYSDGSDWQHTDVEDQRMKRRQARGGERAEAPQSGQNQKHGLGGPGNPGFKSAGHELSPIYMIKNMADVIQKRGQLFWSNASRETSSSSSPSSPHTILLPQPRLLPSTVQLRKPLSLNSVSGKKIKGTYLPILNSYPRIAPLPSKKPPAKCSFTEEAQNRSKRVRTEREIIDTPESQHLPDQRLFKQPSASVRSCCSSAKDARAACSSRQTFQSASSLSSTTSFHTTRRLQRNGTTSTRHRRFLNTVEILRQSGLLDITLHTKDLLRQSNATERDIAQLRQHTELLCQAAGSHSLDSVTPWEHLYRAMAESRSYPNLPNLQISTHPHSATQPAKPSRAGAGSSDASSPYLFTSVAHPNQICPAPQQPHQEQAGEFEASNKFSDQVTFTPPDSSTD